MNTTKANPVNPTLNKLCDEALQLAALGALLRSATAGGEPGAADPAALAAVGACGQLIHRLGTQLADELLELGFTDFQAEQPSGANLGDHGQAR